MTYSYSHPSSTVDLKAIAIATQRQYFIIPTDPDSRARSALQIRPASPGPRIRPTGPDQPHSSRTVPQVRPAGLRQYFLSVPQIQSQVSPADLPRKSSSAPQVQISPADPDH